MNMTVQPYLNVLTRHGVRSAWMTDPMMDHDGRLVIATPKDAARLGRPVEVCYRGERYRDLAQAMGEHYELPVVELAWDEEPEAPLYSYAS